MPLLDFAAAALLVESGRRALGARPGATPQASTADDWRALPEAAARHGMSAWVHAALPDWPDAPSDVRDLVAERSRLQHVRSLQAVSQLAATIALLRQDGIEAVSLKGPLLSRWLYRDLGMRRFADLDLLVDRTDRERALGVLESAGYTLAGGVSAATARTVYAGTGAWPLAHASAFPIDLHWRLQAAGFGAPLQPGEVLRESVVTNVGGIDIRIPSPAHIATLALLHAAKHLWASLELVLTIAHLMRRTDVEWTTVYEGTARAGTWNGAAAGLALASEIFDVELPPPIRDRVRLTTLRPLLRAASGFLAIRNVEGAPLGAELRAHCAALDGMGGRLRYAAWRLLAPTPLEPAWWRLPDRLAPLYAPMRLVRLAVRHRDHGRR